MENKEVKENKNSGLKVAVAILAILLLVSIGYIYNMSSENKQLLSNISTEKTEKEEFKSQLDAKIAEYDSLMTNNSTLNEELLANKEELVKLRDDLEKSKGSAASLQNYKNKYFGLVKEMDNLKAEVMLLKEQNVTLTNNLDSTNVVLNETRIYTDTLLTQNDKLTKTVEKGSKLSVLNLKVFAVKERSSGKQIETDKASRADKLKIGFTIAENEIATSGERLYYVQIIDSQSNVLGEKKTVPMGENTLTYSFISKVKYQNKTVNVDQEVTGTDFKPGSYFVNVFNNKGDNVSRTSFTLK
jgi:Tfp pilus assembly protein PilO